MNWRVSVRRGRHCARTKLVGFRDVRTISRRRFGRDLHRVRLKQMNLIAQNVTARLHGPGGPAAAEPGHVDGGVVAGGLARQQVSTAVLASWIFSRNSCSV